MARIKSDDLKKVSFGTKKFGRARKSNGPKAKKVSKYRGQGK